MYANSYIHEQDYPLTDTTEYHILLSLDSIYKNLTYALFCYYCILHLPIKTEIETYKLRGNFALLSEHSLIQDT